MSNKQTLDLAKEGDRELAMQWLGELDEDFENDVSDGDASQIEDHLEIDESENELQLISDDEENDFDSNNESPIYTAKDGTIWNKLAPKASRTMKQSIIKLRPGLNNKSKSVSEVEDCFKTFIDHEIVDMVVKFTNQKAKSVYEQRDLGKCTKKEWQDCSETEIYATVGPLITMGALKANREPLHFLWCKDPLYSRSIFSATMPRERMQELLSFMRFDDAVTREERRRTDKLAAIREIFEKFVDNCKSSFNPTIDEQLVPFRGKCPFRVYMKSKPAKYGIKLWALVDVETGYALNLQVYTGKENNKPETQQGKQVVLDLVECLGNGYGITTDNFFTGIPLAKELLARNLTLCGTLRKNKREIPMELLPSRQKPVMSSMFCFQDNITLVSYVPKKNACVVLLSTEHHDDKIGTVKEDFKPHIIQHYNKTKGAVDTMDKMVAEYTVQRQTHRWPFVLFQNMVNIAALNAYTVWSTKKENNKPFERRQFLLSLGKRLLKPYVEGRLNSTRGIHRRVVENMRLVVPLSTTDTPQPSMSKSSFGRCAICPRKADKKTRQTCNTCQRFVCKLHQKAIKAVLCKDCSVD